jgi:GT2 family glycosyltransferase
MILNVIVATCNRSANLHDLLDGLLRCEPSLSVKWDVWIIDNNSKDATREVVNEFMGRDPERFHYVFEATPGKSFALNRGIRETSGDVAVFTDDDCIPDPHWLENITREFSSRPDLGILGGRIELFDPRDKPITIRTWLDRRTLSSGTEVFYFIAGCNMAIRRGVLQVVGEFDPDLGPASPSDAAEDADFIYRAFRKGVRVEYVPDILVYHNHGRRTDLDVRNLKHKYFRGRGAFYAKNILRRDWMVLQMAYWEIRSHLVNLFGSLARRKPIGAQWQDLCSLIAGMASRITS